MYNQNINLDKELVKKIKQAVIMTAITSAVSGLVHWGIAELKSLVKKDKKDPATENSNKKDQEVKQPETNQPNQS